jgi:hypothetical protein
VGDVDAAVAVSASVADRQGNTAAGSPDRLYLLAQAELVDQI